MNQWDANVQYFAILHDVKEIHNTKNTLTLVFILNPSCTKGGWDDPPTVF